jgi:mRNA-degrading endonuclease toxin of MazEF toxin-antitoxin module
MNSAPLRGCLYWVKIPGEPDAKHRPALVVSVDARNRLANDVLVVPASITLFRIFRVAVFATSRSGSGYKVTWKLP